MRNVTVVTGIFGDYDKLKQQPTQTGIAVEFVCVTDNPNQEYEGGIWEIEFQPRSKLTYPRLAAKVPKVMPWRWALNEDNIVIWMDGSFILKDSESILRLVNSIDTNLDFTWQFAHPARDCIYTEAEFSKNLPKYQHQPITAQADHYRKQGHPERFGLWATGFIVYPQKSALREMTGMQWLAEQVRWTNQDQISQAYIWNLHADSPKSLPGGLIVNDFVTLHPHLDGT
jgi:O-antigen biosynthesis protein